MICQQRHVRSSPLSISKTSTPLLPLMMTTTPSSPSRMSPSGNKGFYAGAKFETHPSCHALPPPPTHWTTPNSRSQSQSASTPTPASATIKTVIPTPTSSKSTQLKSSTPAGSSITSSPVNSSSTTTVGFTPINLMALFASASAARTNANMHHVSSSVHFSPKPIST